MVQLLSAVTAGIREHRSKPARLVSASVLTGAGPLLFMNSIHSQGPLSPWQLGWLIGYVRPKTFQIPALWGTVPAPSQPPGLYDPSFLSVTQATLQPQGLCACPCLLLEHSAPCLTALVLSNPSSSALMSLPQRGPPYHPSK